MIRIPTRPTSGDVHVNRPLTNILVAYLQSATSFIADKVFPVVPVDKKSDTYFKYSKSDWFRDEARERAPGTETAGGGWDIDNTPTYNCRLFGFHKDIADPIRANSDKPIDMDRDAVLFVGQKLLIRREKFFAENYLTASKWAIDYEGGASGSSPDFVQWDDYENSHPLRDVSRWYRKIANLTGYRPNRFVLSPDVYGALCNHPDVLDRVKYTQKGIITEDLLAAMFGVERVLVAWGVVNSAAKGAEDSTAFIATNKALLVYSAPEPSIMLPSGGYTFGWRGLLGGEALGARIKKFRMDELDSDRVEGEMATDMKMVAPDLGVFAYDCLAGT